MNKINEIITVENLKGFLKTLGYDWSGTYYHSFMVNNGLEDEPKMAENISELINEEFTYFTELYPNVNADGTKNGPTLYIKFDFDYLILYEKENRTDRKNQISDPKNYTKEWIMYLIEENGNKYVKALSDSLHEQIITLINKNEEKNGKLQQQIEKNNNELKSDLKEINSLIKEINKKAEKQKKDDSKTK